MSMLLEEGVSPHQLVWFAGQLQQSISRAFHAAMAESAQNMTGPVPDAPAWNLPWPFEAPEQDNDDETPGPGPKNPFTDDE